MDKASGHAVSGHFQEGISFILQFYGIVVPTTGFQRDIHLLQTDAVEPADRFEVRPVLLVFFRAGLDFQIFELSILIDPVLDLEAARHLIQMDAACNPVVVAAILLNIGDCDPETVQ